jgi:CDGSH-type Zn-finger protein
VYAAAWYRSGHDSSIPKEATMTVKLTCRPNGPYLVEGDVEIYDPTGARVDTTGRPRIALCRCGGSVTKPFCDGTHSRIGFQAAEAAVAQEKKS